MRFFYISLLMLIFYFVEICCFEPLTTGLAVGTAILASAVFSTYPTLKSKLFESCDDNWINPQLDELAASLDTALHGQHLVAGPLMRALRGHLRNTNPSKALVLSFHGWTGNGKNYVSNIVADHLYKKGRKSNFVHIFVATHHFPHERRLELYQDQLRSWIRGNTSACERSLFIFDEIDKQPQGLMDTLKPFLDHYTTLDGVNYRRNIYIFLSNAGGNEISGLAHDNWWSGQTREELKLKDMEEAIHTAAFNEDGGMKRSSVIDKNLVSVFVPFLPMERKHIIACIKDDLRRKNLHMTPAQIDAVADELRYAPPDTRLFSTTGCKRVSDKVDLLAEEHSLTVHPL